MIRYFAGVVVRNDQGRILAVHNIERNQWRVPGGKIDNESPLEAAHRELFEEVGLRATVLRQMYVTPPRDINGDGMLWEAHLFLADGVWDVPQLKEPDKHDRLGWLPLEEYQAQSPILREEMEWVKMF